MRLMLSSRGTGWLRPEYDTWPRSASEFFCCSVQNTLAASRKACYTIAAVFFGSKKKSGPTGPGSFGNYYLQELINSGGMADIWLATDRDQQTCALRRLHDDLRFDFTARKRFWRGCEVLSRIHHHDCVI